MDTQNRPNRKTHYIRVDRGIPETAPIRDNAVVCKNPKLVPPVVLLVAQELLRVVTEDVSKVPGIDVTVLSLPHVPDQITERLRKLPLRALTTTTTANKTGCYITRAVPCTTSVSAHPLTQRSPLLLLLPRHMPYVPFALSQQ